MGSEPAGDEAGGWRPTTGLVKVTHDLLITSDKGFVFVLDLLDLSAAFNTTEHHIELVSVLFIRSMSVCTC